MATSAVGVGAAGRTSVTSGGGPVAALARPSPSPDEADLRRLLDAAMHALGQATANDPRGTVLIDRAGRAAFVSTGARRLLREYFPGVPTPPWPPLIERWLQGPADRLLVLPRGARHLVVRRDGDVLLLDTAANVASLTTRELEVLRCVARGMTNREVAEALTVAPSTVRTHLEHVFAKLGVSTRTAAVSATFLAGAHEARAAP